MLELNPTMWTNKEKKERDVATHLRGVFFVSEGQLVGSKDQRGEGETNPLVSTCSKVFPRCVQDLQGKVGGLFRSNILRLDIRRHLWGVLVALEPRPTRYCWSGSSE